jgi:hypothetical protein
MICRSERQLVDVWPRQAFISYAHEGKSWMERVLEVLKPLEGEGLIAAWHDGKLLPGDQWHAKILAQMADADLVLLLVSDSLLGSSYVNDTEIPFALERANRGQVDACPGDFGVLRVDAAIVLTLSGSAGRPRAVGRAHRCGGGAAKLPRATAWDLPAARRISYGEGIRRRKDRRRFAAAARGLQNGGRAAAGLYRLAQWRGHACR